MASGDCRLCIGVPAVLFSVVGGLAGSTATTSASARVASSWCKGGLAKVEDWTAGACPVSCLWPAGITDEAGEYGLSRSRGFDTAGLGSSLGAGEGSMFVVGVLGPVLHVSFLW